MAGVEGPARGDSGPFVFICYNHVSERAYVQGLASFLRAERITPWFDEEIDPGLVWMAVINERIDTCSAFIVVMTPAAFASEEVRREINRAVEKQKEIVPLLLEGEVFPGLKQLQYEDVRGGLTPGSQLVARLRSLLAQPVTRREAVTIPEPDLLMPFLMPQEAATPDTAIDGGSVGALVVRAASVRGVAHRQNGQLRQDAYGMCADRDKQWLVVAVADGDPFGTLSHEASNLVARRGPQEVIERLSSPGRAGKVDWYEVVGTLNRVIIEEGRRSFRKHYRKRLSPREYGTLSTTVTLVVCDRRTPDRAMNITILCIGDSPVWTLDTRNGEWRRLTQETNPDRTIPEYLTASLPQRRIQRSRLFLDTTTVQPGEALLIMTDGVADPLDDGSGDVGQFLGKVWCRPPDLLDFARQVAFDHWAADGDRTVVGLWLPNRPVGR